MPQARIELTLDDPLEQDIGDYMNVRSIQSTSSRNSTATTSTFAGSAKPQPWFPAGFDVPVPVQTVTRKHSLSHHTSPSSPVLAPHVRPLQLSRSQTLPRVLQVEKKQIRQIEIDALPIDGSLVAKVRRWILGIAIVEFDVDDGPVIDGIIPPTFLLPTEAENISFSAFPDSLQFEQGQQSHSFRIREQIVTHDKRPRSEDGFIYGYSHFTQRRDPALKRGYQQCSLVILTHHQYPALYSSLASILGPLFQAHGVPMLEAACHNIATWQDPKPGSNLEIGFLGTVLEVCIPNSSDEQQWVETANLNNKANDGHPRQYILASMSPAPPPPLLLFESSLSHLWSMWECLVLCEPILVFGTSPAQTSQAIWWLRDLLRPVPFAGDIRPYFTLQDCDSSSLVNKLPPKPGLLLGVTNPFFEKACAHWPHTLSLGRKIQESDTPHTAGPSPGWKTKTHKRYISKDRAILRHLENALRGHVQTHMDASLVLRRHFGSRTTELITPIARYLNTLIPTPDEVSKASCKPTSHKLRLKPFNNTNFFTSLSVHGSTLPFKSTSKRTEFYTRWLKSPTFGMWLAQQEYIVQTVLDKSLIQISSS